MAQDRIFNFSAGPSALPLSVLQKAASEMTNYGGSGMSVMEMSHRSKVYQDIFDETKANLIKVLNIPETHEVIFMQGGATFQFSAVPLNLIGTTGKADYALTGSFSTLAAKEAKKYGKINIVASSEDKNHTYIPSNDQLKLSPDAAYFHYCANNTIYGTEWNYIPDTGKVPLVADCSSNILSRPIDISRYGLIYAGVQKNMAPAGMAAVIVRRELAGHELPFTPIIMSYQTTINKDSMYNTPPTYNIYMLGLVLKWVIANGGVRGMEELRNTRSSLLYDFIDDSSLFIGCADKDSRSKMNVTFRTGNEELDNEFVKEASAHGFVNLKGHRSVGGMRASIYNAMPVEGVEKLVDFMKDFEVRHKGA
ncbi:MAG: 3-phosphoserine/phosphohydroxythreonine transaminase [Oscillospiraceae bacterium]